MSPISNLASTVRIQVEVMALLVSLQRSIAAALTYLVVVDERQRSTMRKNTLLKTGVPLLEPAVTTTLMLWILQWKFSTGANTRAWCNNRKHARSGKDEHDRFVWRVVLCLASFAIFGVGVGSIFGVASVENVLSLANYRSVIPAEAVQVAMRSMVADPILEEAFYRGVVFDRLLDGSGEEASYTTAREAATASSSLFGGTHLLMHFFRDGLTLSWRDYHQALWATGAGYVFCLLYFLSGGRLLPTVLLHFVNNIAASFYSSNNKPRGASDTSCPSRSFGNDRSRENVPQNTSITIASIGKWASTAPPTLNITSDCRAADQGGRDQTPCAQELCQTGVVVNSGVAAGTGADIPRSVCAGYVATALAYCVAGRACLRRLQNLNARSDARNRLPARPVGPRAHSLSFRRR